MLVHKSVLLKDILDIFDPKPNDTYIDATINGGGHAKAILKKIGPEGKLLGIDWDCDLINKLKSESEATKIKNLKAVCANYADILIIAENNNFSSVNGILFDLGFSSYHPEMSGRGFSFMRDEPLDMRYNPALNDLTAEKIINSRPSQEIEDIIRNFGEERFAKRIAAAIVERRNIKKISKTNELVEIIAKSIPKHFRKGGIHYATRTFQALRIAVNDELGNLKRGLKDSITLLAPFGKIAVISFHSLEDRIVKEFFKTEVNKKNLELITKKPINPLREEIRQNYRSRSAKLRAAVKIIK